MINENTNLFINENKQQLLKTGSPMIEVRETVECANSAYSLRRYILHTVYGNATK